MPPPQATWARIEAAAFTGPGQLFFVPEDASRSPGYKATALHFLEQRYQQAHFQGLGTKMWQSASWEYGNSHHFIGMNEVGVWTKLKKWLSKVALMTWSVEWSKISTESYPFFIAVLGVISTESYIFAKKVTLFVDFSVKIMLKVETLTTIL